MARLAALASWILLLLPASSHAVTVDLVDGSGSLDWDTTVSVTSPAPNSSVTHPLFPANRHPHEGWFIYLPDFGLLHEFTSFAYTSDGGSQDTVSSTWTTFFCEDITLSLTYGITAFGPDGLPNLDWDGDLFRPLNPVSPFPVIHVRLFNVFDYDVGDDPSGDSVTLSQSPFPGPTLFEFAGDGGISGQRGAFFNTGYSADTLGNILSQITVDNVLNDSVAAGPQDMAGAFMWEYMLCSSPTAAPGCDGAGAGIGGFGGFGGFVVPEPSTGLLLLAGLGGLAARRRSE